MPDPLRVTPFVVHAISLREHSPQHQVSFTPYYVGHDY